MKLRTVLIIALALTASLSSCAAAEREYTLDDANTLLGSGAFEDGLAEVSGPMIPMLYGVDEEEIVEYISYQTTNAAVSCDEITVLVLRGEEAAKAAEKACRERIESEIANAQSYSPAALPSLEAAYIDRVGSTVLLAVGDPDKLPNAIKSLRS